MMRNCVLGLFMCVLVLAVKGHAVSNGGIYPVYLSQDLVHKHFLQKRSSDDVSDLAGKANAGGIFPMFLAQDLVHNHFLQKRSSTDGCDLATVVSKIQRCGVQEIATYQSLAKLNSVCANLECKLKCYADAVGECYKTDALFAVEPEPNFVFARASCKNTTATSIFYEQCLRADQCLVNFASGLLYEAVPLLESGQYSRYRSKYCSIISDFHLCMEFEHKACPSGIGKFGEDMFRAGLSFDGCGADQSTPFFAKYGGSNKCGVPVTTQKPIPTRTPAPTQSPTNDQHGRTGTNMAVLSSAIDHLVILSSLVILQM